jgi:uncharacterized protein (UPF0548 family)
VFLFHRPVARDVERFIAASRDLPLSYQPIGLAKNGGAAVAGASASRDGFQIDEHVAIVGSGDAAFARATTALIQWRHYELGWLDVSPKPAPIVPGTVVAVSVSHLGFWSLNGCRVVYSIGSPGDSTFGFAYGTLANHAEAGEEIFQVSLDPDTGEVSYLIRAASKPRAVLARLGTPVVRRLQARFRRDSARALQRAVAV